MDIPEIGYVFQTTAVLTAACLKHFNISENLVSLYGVKVSDIITIDLEISKNQELLFDDNINDYWGWYDFKSKRFTIIYDSYFLLNMCFPDGLEISIKNNRGLAFRLDAKHKMYE